MLNLGECCEIDMPWYECRFAPTEAFAELAPLFAEELRLLEAEDWEAWDQAYERIVERGVTLIPAGEEP